MRPNPSMADYARERGLSGAWGVFLAILPGLALWVVLGLVIWIVV